ncbi:hypothetical protein ACN47E_006265 [Coniothyrium glycines]
MATLSVPSPDPSFGLLPADKKGARRPLSTHGLPKEPRKMSPEGRHRSSTLGLPFPSSSGTPRSARSPEPMSPPMSAKSFGTFIDSEPCTPTYSPKMDNGWDSSTLVLLRPDSSSSEPTSPTEPTWDMMVPIKVPSRTMLAANRLKQPTTTSKEICAATSLASHPPKNSKLSNRPKDIKIIDMQPREDPLRKQVATDGSYTAKTVDDESSVTSPLPFGKLASKMRFMLRRRSTSDKKKPKKEKEQMEVDRLEDIHWTEM